MDHAQLLLLCLSVPALPCLRLDHSQVCIHRNDKTCSDQSPMLEPEDSLQTSRTKAMAQSTHGDAAGALVQDGKAGLVVE